MRYTSARMVSQVGLAGAALGDIDLATGGYQLILDAGTAADPAIVFGNDDDGTGTGIYRVGANQIGFSSNGSLAAFVSNNGLQIKNAYNIILEGTLSRIYNSNAAVCLGTVAATSHALGTGDVLVGNDLEVDGDIYADGNVIMGNLPVADPTIAGALWNDGGTLKVSAG